MKRPALLVAVSTLALVAVATATANAGTTPMGKKFKLPYAGSITSSQIGFEVTNLGNGDAISGHSKSGYGLSGYTTSGLAGIYGLASGDSNGIYGTVNNSDASGVKGVNGGSGTGVTGTSSTGDGLYGFTSTGYSAVAGYTTGPNNGVYGETTSNASGVYGHNGGTGNGLGGISDHGTGVWAAGVTGGYFKGGGGSNAALALESGGVRVVGAGTDTPTPVFRHQPAAGNLCFGNLYTILDNPFLNGNPNAFVFLGTDGTALRADYSPGADCPAGRWAVASFVGSSAITWTSGSAPFSVMVVDP